MVRRLDSYVYRTNYWGVASCRGPPAPKGQGLGFTVARKQKAWHSWIHIGKRIAWNNLWSGALDSCVYRTNHWGVASCRGPPAPKGQGLGFTVARKQKAWHSWIHIGKRIARNNLWSGAWIRVFTEQITGGWHPAGVRQRQRARAWVSNFAKICLSTGKCQKTIAKTKKTKKTKKKLEIWPGGARDARLISSIFFGFFGFSNGFFNILFPYLGNFCNFLEKSSNV